MRKPDWIDPRVTKTYGLDVLRDLETVIDGCRHWRSEFGYIQMKQNAISLADRICREDGAAVHVWYDGDCVYRAYPEGFTNEPLGMRPAADSNATPESTSLV